jgi:asparagine synthase (glutamine-hydrolysing)
MCGLVGSFALGDRDLDPATALAAMTTCLSHRGPDGDGRYVSPRVAFGFRRLAINDPEHGQQPFRTSDGRVTAICNGEIFNYPQLRGQALRQGYRLRTRCDSEILLPAYLAHGTALVHELDGQFAFAIHDSATQRLVLARDPAGVIPLFYTMADDMLIFASEIKAILSHPRVRCQVDLAGLDQVCSLPGLVSPRTMFAGVRSLRPGERLVADRDGIRLDRYQDLVFPLAGQLPKLGRQELGHELDRCAEQTAAALGTAVRDRVVADVPVGMYLSGGLDSSLVGGLMTAARPDHSWPSFSVTFPGHDFDESYYQQLMASYLGTRHIEVAVRDEDFAAHFTAMIRHAECPVRESYNICSLLLAEAVKSSGTAVILSGEGADELFAGYLGYRFQVAKPTAGRLGGLDAMLEDEARTRMWGTNLRYEHDQITAQEFRRELYAADLADALDEFSVTSQPLVDATLVVGRHPLHQRSYLDFHLRLADHLLGDHGDRMAMASAVELRFPFLSRDLISLATVVPPDVLLADGNEKAVLRRAAAGIVPAEILSRPKFGFRGQTSSDLLASGSEWFPALLSPDLIRRQGYFNESTVHALLQRQRNGAQAIHAHLDIDYLMIVATFALFVEEFNLPYLG